MRSIVPCPVPFDHPDTLDNVFGVAASLEALDRRAEAVPIIDECVLLSRGNAVDPGMIPAVMDVRLRHFAKTTDAAGCGATAKMWEELKRSDAGSLYNAACFRAVTAGVIRAGNQSEDAAKKAAAEAERAMDWLKQAVVAGFNDVAHMKQDTDLEALRDRDDFRKLLEEMGKSAQPPRQPDGPATGNAPAAADTEPAAKEGE